MMQLLLQGAYTHACTIQCVRACITFKPCAFMCCCFFVLLFCELKQAYQHRPSGRFCKTFCNESYSRVKRHPPCISTYFFLGGAWSIYYTVHNILFVRHSQLLCCFTASPTEAPVKVINRKTSLSIIGGGPWIKRPFPSCGTISVGT